MNLIRDCLDMQLVDRNDCHMGKCDGIVITLRNGQQPEVTHIEIGAVTLANRLHPRLGAWIAGMSNRLGISRHDPYRVPWSKVVVTGVTVTVGLDAEETDALAWERWLRRNVVGRIPGA
jgi:hypothetical protein